MATIPAGRIGRLFGTEGGVMLSLYGAFPEDFDPDRTPLVVTIDSLEVPLWCERFERRGTAGAVAAFADLDNDRRARELLGLEFRIEQPAEEENDEFYLEDLIGFAVTAEEIGSAEAPALANDPSGMNAPDPGAPRPQAGAGKTSVVPGTLSAESRAHTAEQEVQPDELGPQPPAHRALRGTLTDYYDSDANPLFELEIDGRQVLVPAAEEFIAHIDFGNRTMHLVLPEGLLDLQ